jgi:membrane-anchored mycosin MYCP
MTTSGTNAKVTSPGEEVQFVVAREHAELVMSVLPGHGVTGVQPEHDDGLGLTLIEGFLDRNALPDPPEPDGDCRPSDPAEADRLLLRRLREHFEQKHAGWSPTMGRNRLMGPADEEVSSGGGTVSHGGGPDPKGAAAGARPTGSRGLGMTVGVLDTALIAHPDLAGGYVGTAPRDVLSARGVDVRPYSAGHATFVTGLILQQAPGATVRVRQVLDGDGQASSWDVAKAIVELGESGIQILNLSLVCYSDDGKPPLVLATAIDRLDTDILVIACAGNHGDPGLAFSSYQDYSKPAWPAALDDVVAVGSGKPESGSPGYAPSSFTPRGVAWIDVITRGEEVTSTYFTGKGVRSERDSVNDAGEVTFDGWAEWGGTSFAAARLTGRVAAVAAEKKISPRAAYRKLVDEARAEQPYKVQGQRVPPFLDF